jgi:hypothetical protein
MTATEQWIFLCAAHKTPKECPAIDYTRHTLDGAACLLNSNKYFPSRVSIKVSDLKFIFFAKIFWILHPIQLRTGVAFCCYGRSGALQYYITMLVVLHPE